MNKPRKTPVPLPSSKVKASPKGALSQEFVDSSDDSSHETAPTPKTTQRKTTVNIAVHRPKTNGILKVVPKSAKRQEAAPRSTAKTSTPLKKAAPKKVVIEEQSAESSSSSEESNYESETDIRAARRRQESDSPESGTASTSSSEGSTDESDEERPVQNLAVSQPRPTQPQAHQVDFRPAKPYVPPKDFHPVPTNRASSLSSNTIFENLGGKQVWHITAPADVPLKDLKELVMENALQGDAVINHKGIDYDFSVADSDESAAQEVMMPRQNGYKAVPTRISHTFKIRQVLDLPKLKASQIAQNTGSEAAASITQSTIRAPRPQIKGLKMRFFPSGVEDQSPITMGSSDSEGEAHAARPAGLAVPNGIHLPSKSKKRKHDHRNGDERLESPTKKHKHRTPEEIKRREEKKAKKERKREREAARAKT